MLRNRPTFDSPDSEIQFDRAVHKAKSGNPDAQFELGGMYVQGQVGSPSCMLNRKPDYKQACKWLHLAAEQGHVEAQNSLGIRCNRGEGVDLDHAEACKWFRLAEAGGSIRASVNLAMNLLRGLGEAQNVDEALARFRKAADLSDPLAQYHLGGMYQEGYAVQKDSSAAKVWYRYAAEQNFVPAQSMLGYLYVTEPDGEDDLIEAYVWLSLAASSGDAGARNNFRAYAERLEEGLRIEAEQRVSLHMKRWSEED